MEIVKKNLFSIICGVVAVAAVVAVFVWPLNGYFDELSQKAQARAAVYGKIDTLTRKTRSLPVFDPKNPEAGTLTRFPSNTLIKRGKDAKDEVNAKSMKTYDLAWHLNYQGHGLAVPNSLPNPSSVTQINFRSDLQKKFDELREGELAAGVPPTPEQLEIRKGAIWDELKKKLVVVGDQVTNKDQVMAEYDDLVRKLPDVMKQEMATGHKMYINPLEVMKVSALIPDNGKAPDVVSMWWAQVEYWVARDVGAAIAEMNANAKNVTDAPVKNLVALIVKDDFFPSIGGVGGAVGGGRVMGTTADSGAAGDAGATPATGGQPDPTVALPDGSSISPTKRISNNLFDVVQFTMSVDVDADQVALFLKTLATNRFLTVTRLEMNPVDSQLMQVGGYVYGSRPVVTLNLDCESLFMRQWTINLMPDMIKRALGIPTGPGDTQQPAVAPQPVAQPVAPAVPRRGTVRD
ncbi:MAG TPA: hypothetical protein VH475_17710 [Tepidisphaeraceae bacterium]|jgi:hypothetical protein